MSLFPPPLAGALGAGGLVPFLATSAPVQLVLPFDALLKPLRNAIGRPSLNATELQVTYGCMILSFLGAPKRRCISRLNRESHRKAGSSKMALVTEFVS